VKLVPGQDRALHDLIRDLQLDKSITRRANSVVPLQKLVMAAKAARCVS
jgi:chemotaxis regulatin CheY-phosphate phosphatase CheZ